MPLVAPDTVHVRTYTVHVLLDEVFHQNIKCRALNKSQRTTLTCRARALAVHAIFASSATATATP